MKTFAALLLIVSVATSGCATASATRVTGRSATDVAVWAEYARNIPIGSRVKVGLADGSALKGTLMRVDSSALLINPATRVPEAPVEVPLTNVLALELDRPGGTAKAVVIGAVAGVGATFGVLFLLFALTAD